MPKTIKWDNLGGDYVAYVGPFRLHATRKSWSVEYTIQRMECSKTGEGFTCVEDNKKQCVEVAKRLVRNWLAAVNEE